MFLILRVQRIPGLHTVLIHSLSRSDRRNISYLGSPSVPSITLKLSLPDSPTPVVSWSSVFLPTFFGKLLRAGYGYSPLSKDTLENLRRCTVESPFSRWTLYRSSVVVQPRWPYADLSEYRRFLSFVSSWVTSQLNLYSWYPFDPLVRPERGVRERERNRKMNGRPGWGVGVRERSKTPMKTYINVEPKIRKERGVKGDTYHTSEFVSRIHI